MLGLPQIVSNVTWVDRTVHVLSVVFFLLWIGYSLASIYNGDEVLIRDIAAFGITAAFLYWLMRRSLVARFREQSSLNQMFAVAHLLDTGFVNQKEMDEAKRTFTQQREIYGEIERGSTRDQLLEAAFIVVINLQWGFGDRFLALLKNWSI